MLRSDVPRSLNSSFFEIWWRLEFSYYHLVRPQLERKHVQFLACEAPRFTVVELRFYQPSYLLYSLGVVWINSVCTSQRFPAVHGSVLSTGHSFTNEERPIGHNTA